MIEIKNHSQEPWEVVPHLRPETPGFRLAQSQEVPAARIEPGTSIAFMGYEPGVLFEVRPVYNYSQPRSGLAGPREG